MLFSIFITVITFMMGKENLSSGGMKVTLLIDGRAEVEILVVEIQEFFENSKVIST